MAINYLQKKDLKWDDLFIKGGFVIRIPEQNMHEEDHAQYMKYWKRAGLTTREAEAKIKLDNQKIFNTRFIMLLREWLRRKAKKYMEMFPHLGLNGFKPDVICRLFVPGRDPGGTGDVAVIHALTKMGRMEEDERND